MSESGTLTFRVTAEEVADRSWHKVFKDKVGVEHDDHSSVTWASTSLERGGYDIKVTVIEGHKRPWRKGADMQFSVNTWKMLEKVLAFDGIRTAYLHGPPGVGKTYAAYHFGRVGHGFYACTLTDETSAAELRGHFIFKGGDAIWHNGPFVRAMREGKRLVINEITNASSDVLALLFPILESFETACLTLPNGETIRPAEGFHVIATDNRAPEMLPEALQDRFMAYVEVTTTHPSALKGIGKDLQKVAEQTIGEGDRLISARGWHSLDVMQDEFGIEDSCSLAFGETRGRKISDALKLAMEERAYKETAAKRKEEAIAKRKAADAAAEGLLAAEAVTDGE